MITRLKRVYHKIIGIIKKAKMDIRYLKRKLTDIRQKKASYPTILQLPITYKCNFDCIMCGMKHQITKAHFSSDELGKILHDEVFQNVVSVGVNGGEPFLRQDLIDCIRQILKLPKLRGIAIITNGSLPKKILSDMYEIKKLCSERNVTVTLSVSVDGINDMQEFMRGNKNAFTNAEHLLTVLKEKKEQYCDGFNIICTIASKNIARITELKAWADLNKYDVAYNIATIHKRIENEDRYSNFSIFEDEYSRKLAEEFFYGLFIETKSERYFAIYYYIKTGKRLSYCEYQESGITLLPNGEIAYCATCSETIGNALEENPSKIYEKGFEYRKILVNEKCMGCSHYMYILNSAGLLEYNKEIKKTMIL